MIQPKHYKQNNTIFLGFDSIEINLVLILWSVYDSETNRQWQFSLAVSL